MLFISSPRCSFSRFNPEKAFDDIDETLLVFISFILSNPLKASYDKDSMFSSKFKLDLFHKFFHSDLENSFSPNLILTLLLKSCVPIICDLSLIWISSKESILLKAFCFTMPVLLLIVIFLTYLKPENVFSSISFIFSGIFISVIVGSSLYRLTIELSNFLTDFNNFSKSNFLCGFSLTFLAPKITAAVNWIEIVVPNPANNIFSNFTFLLVGFLIISLFIFI